MVQVRDISDLVSDGQIDPDAWLDHTAKRVRPDQLPLIRSALQYATLTGEDSPNQFDESCLQQGIVMADLLIDLHLDQETIAAALIYGCYQHTELSEEDIADNLGAKVAKLITGSERLQAARAIQERSKQQASDKPQQDNIRKMLLTMVDDPRVVLVKLAEHIYTLRRAKLLNEVAQQRIAEETNTIYAPLANRLGIAQLKWEQEDLAFRYLHSDIYKDIAKRLKARRLDRERFVQRSITELVTALNQVGIDKAEIKGRAKHIYSIYRKMQRKNVDYDEIYDAHAIRVLVNSIAECYTVLGIVHELWIPIPEEFDDYIATPKPNGYRSLHTAVQGPDGKNLEVQIRTHKMDSEAELGVAAHWAYKEGAAFRPDREGKITWLRQLLEWQQELASGDESMEAMATEFMEDRIYVFTPKGDILDLAKGATPLDFAYHVHSAVGHRCRGAKINGKIVPLTYELQTGEQIEVLTTKEPAPSRDWLNKDLGYLKTPRARSKVLHWFRLQSYESNMGAGRDILEKELKRLAITTPIDYNKVADKLNYKKGQDVLAAVGGGDLKSGQVISAIQSTHKLEQVTEEPTPPVIKQRQAKPRGSATDVHIRGVGNLLTQIARCCKPVPGDAIVGYITQGRGVSIHRQDCINFLHMAQEHHERLVEVEWDIASGQKYPVDIAVNAYDRQALVRDVTALLANERIGLLKLNVNTDAKENTAQLSITIEVDSLDSLSRIFNQLCQINNVIDVKRVNT